MFWRTLVAAGLLCGIMFGAAKARDKIDLNGTWEFRLDPQSQGDTERWYSQQARFTDSIQVPGCWQAQGFGTRSGILRNDYSGPAWYRKAVEIPASWRNRRVTIRIGGALRIVELFVNGVPAGTHDGMSAPFTFDISDSIRAGAHNSIAIKVTNPGQVPGESPDKQAGSRPTGMLNYIGNWGGIYGPVELQASSRIWIDDVWIRPDVASRAAQVQVTVHNGEDKPFRGRLRAAVGPTEQRAPVEVAPGQSVGVKLTLSVPGARLWSPEDPQLYTAAVSLSSGGLDYDQVELRFGMREIATRGNVLLLNGKPLYLRGYGDDNVEVISGVPPASKQIYLERLRTARSFGFNMVRFHSMVPVQQFFDAADETGLLVMAELPVAYTQYLLPNKDFLRNELKSVILAHRNHPSWLSLAMGNEFNLRWLPDESTRHEFLETVKEFYGLAKGLMPDRIVMSNDGLRMEPTDMLSIGRQSDPNHPVVRHEFGEYYCSLPDTSLIPSFTGVIAPEWLAAKERWVEENGLAKQYATYVRNSQRLVQLGRKFQIERVRRDPDVTGYEYWLVTDYPGGTGEGDSWEEGWFDFFWHPKGIRPEEGREINSAVLPLIDADPARRTLWAEDPTSVKVSVSNYGGRDLNGDAGSWRTSCASRPLAEGRFATLSAPDGKVSPLGAVRIGGVATDAAEKIQLTAAIDGNTNRWDFWSFPRQNLLKETQTPVVSAAAWPGLKEFYPFIHPPSGDERSPALTIVSALNDEALDTLRSGGRVWLALDKPGKLTFFPASGGALGTVIEQHPALAGFPHEGFADLQFYSLMEHATPLELDKLSRLQPIMGGIRTRAAFLSKAKDLSRVGYILEARVGAGRMLITTLRIGSLLDDAHPEAVYLFDRLLRYCLSDAFQPRTEISAETLTQVVKDYMK